MNRRFEFHISRLSREIYRFDEELYASSGNVIFPNFRAVRIFAKQMNDVRSARGGAAPAVRAGQLHAMGLIDEINHFLMRSYEESNPGVVGRALAFARQTAGEEAVERTLRQFCEHFPPAAVYRGGEQADRYLASSTGGVAHREITLEELLMLWLANANPAFRQFAELFDETPLASATPYEALMGALREFFAGEKPFGPKGQSIIDALMAPILAHPDSLADQLRFIRRMWGLLLSRRLSDLLLSSEDLMREDDRAVFPGGGQAAAEVPDFWSLRRMLGAEADLERFTEDTDWMPRVVLLAKNIYVWLDQLSKKYGRRLSRLDDIPDGELDILAAWHFTGLWLIGVWQRSAASQAIKQMMGNPEAVASAYSLYDYVIADDLGGENAFLRLKERAEARGIRLAGDMVPNHVGIFSKWVVEHPEYFIQLGHPPFPGYAFTGPNLSGHPDVELRIEDGYWTRRDAAVVFQRVDRRSGEVRYIYHGNDGTHLPWNDTAQLDFLRADVREAVIQAILHVARKFSIIRFDAAMTLTKMHFQRLWFPQPGSGGAIPSRADHGTSKERFDELMPAEFWREVVDRFRAEIPNTLLLAEAFWLLEGFFVRTLGMHRVYNSAFMHMTMREENEKFRDMLKSTLAYNPEILKRYVNFMSNPDEETAVGQFGKGDKYFGVAAMMVTLPGLPMFAHGQVEGFGEKYGMEYRRAYHDEHPDEQLIDRHRREIFPLTRKRYLFSEADEFQLYDVVDGHGAVNHAVIAYTNRRFGERALFLYNNRYAVSDGWIARSVTKVRSTGDLATAEERKTVGAALGLSDRHDIFYLLYEHRSGRTFVRSGEELVRRGMYVHLQGYEYQLFEGFAEVEDADGRYRQLAAELAGRGVADVAEALEERALRPLHEALREFIAGEHFRDFHAALTGTVPAAVSWKAAIGELVRLAAAHAGAVPAPGQELRLAAAAAGTLLGRHAPAERGRFSWEEESGRAALRILVWTILQEVAGGAGGRFPTPLSAFAGLRLSKVMETAYLTGGYRDDRRRDDIALVSLLAAHHGEALRCLERESLCGLEAVIGSEEAGRYIGTNTHEGVVYYSKERCEELLDWLLVGAACSLMARGGGPSPDAKTPVLVAGLLTEMRRLSDSSRYQLREFTRRLQNAPPADVRPAGEEQAHE